MQRKEQWVMGNVNEMAVAQVRPVAPVPVREAGGGVAPLSLRPWVTPRVGV
jgi:hypothetical protein